MSKRRKRIKPKIKRKTAIRTETAEEFKKVLEIFEKKNRWVWADGKIPLTYVNDWKWHKKNICIEYKNKFICHSLSYFLREVYRIINFEEFLMEEELNVEKIKEEIKNGKEYSKQTI